MASSLTPDPLRGIWPDFDWENERVWAVEAPTGEMAVSDLAWLLDLPLWSTRPPEPLFDLRPRAVLEDQAQHAGHAQRIATADLQYPLDLFEVNGRWVVLDGVHRLARLTQDGARRAAVRCLPASALPLIRREAP
jgi:hypothetical protein